MPREFRLPDLGEGLTEAEIVRLLVAEGEEIKEDQPILLVETEKAQVELPSPFGGRVAKIHVRAGERVKVGSVLFTFAEDAPPPPPAPPPRRPGEGGAALRVIQQAPPRRAATPAVTAAPVPSAPPAMAPSATPATRRLARELGVDLAAVRGSGPGGRITEADVRAAASAAPTAAHPEAPAGPRPAAAAEPAPAEPLRLPAAHAELPPLPRFEQWGPVEREPLRGVRRRSAEHLALAWSLVPHVTHHDQADITALEALRRERQATAEGGGALTLTVFLVKAAALLLRTHPRFNASLDHQTGELVLKRYYHIGVAADTERGLVVPVVRDVDRKRLPELAAELARLVARTREGKATVEDLRGGTFTVTNTGGLGGTGATPIVNYPEVAILGVGRARETPVVRDGAVVIRLILPLSLAFDHRVIDGMEAARFMAELVGLLEDPERLVLAS